MLFRLRYGQAKKFWFFLLALLMTAVELFEQKTEKN